MECSPQVDRADLDDDAGSGLDAHGFASHLLCEELQAGPKTAPLVFGEGTGPPAALGVFRASIVETPGVQVEAERILSQFLAASPDHSLGWRLRGPLVGAAATRGLVEAGIA